MESVYLSGKCFVDLYECLIISSFFCLTWLASKSIQLIIVDVRTYSSLSRQAASYQVKKWMQHYSCITSFVDGINEFFETPLLLYIVKQFSLFSLLIIKATFEAYHGNNLDIVIQIDAIDFMRNLVLMLLVIIGSQRMKNQVFMTKCLFTWLSERCQQCQICFQFGFEAEDLVDELTTRRYLTTKFPPEVSFSFKPNWAPPTCFIASV